MAETTTQSATDDDKTKNNGDDKPLGEAGEKALQAERDARKKLEAEVKKLTEAAAKAEREKQESENAKKDELQKAQEKLAELETSMQKTKDEQMRLEIASEKVPEGTPLAKVRSLARRLTGTTREELEADADEFIADVFPKKDDAGESKDGGEDEQGLNYLGPRGTPREDLQSGATSKPAADSDDKDYGKIAASIFEGDRI